MLNLSFCYPVLFCDVVSNQNKKINMQLDIKNYRNWTSLDLAKPVWEDETSDQAGHLGSVEPLDSNKWPLPLDTDTYTYGVWDQSIDIKPASSR